VQIGAKINSAKKGRGKMTGVLIPGREYQGRGLAQIQTEKPSLLGDRGSWGKVNQFGEKLV